jgi:hypothetical protein
MCTKCLKVQSPKCRFENVRKCRENLVLIMKDYRIKTKMALDITDIVPS